MLQTILLLFGGSAGGIALLAVAWYFPFIRQTALIAAGIVFFGSAIVAKIRHDTSIGIELKQSRHDKRKLNDATKADERSIRDNASPDGLRANDGFRR